MDSSILVMIMLFCLVILVVTIINTIIVYTQDGASFLLTWLIILSISYIIIIISFGIQLSETNDQQISMISGLFNTICLLSFFISLFSLIQYWRLYKNKEKMPNWQQNFFLQSNSIILILATLIIIQQKF